MSARPYPRTPIPVALARAIELALDAVLSVDPASVARITELEGRRVGLELKGLDLHFVLHAREGRFEVEAARLEPQRGDLTLRASPGGLLALALGAAGGLPVGHIELSGDAELGRRLEALLRQLDPDWEEPLARSFGDVLGVRIADGLRRAWRAARAGLRTLAEDGADFLREESRLVVAPAELEAFLDAVDLLRERVDRLQVRIQRLRSRVGDR